MDQRDSHCPYVVWSETTAKGTGFMDHKAGKEDPVELDSGLSMFVAVGSVAHVWESNQQ